jgi:hypothetical protein
MRKAGLACQASRAHRSHLLRLKRAATAVGLILVPARAQTAAVAAARRTACLLCERSLAGRGFPIQAFAAP